MAAALRRRRRDARGARSQGRRVLRRHLRHRRLPHGDLRRPRRQRAHAAPSLRAVRVSLRGAHVHPSGGWTRPAGDTSLGVEMRLSRRITPGTFACTGVLLVTALLAAGGTARAAGPSTELVSVSSTGQKATGGGTFAGGISA